MTADRYGHLFPRGDDGAPSLQRRRRHSSEASLAGLAVRSLLAAKIWSAPISQLDLAADPADNAITEHRLRRQHGRDLP
jgi:hypothetical protein